MNILRLMVAFAWISVFAVPVSADVGSAQEQFEAIKALAGKWRGYKDGDRKEVVEVEFRVLSGGSTVAEFLMPGTKWEMLRVFSRDRDRLIATHYCALGNQSRLRAVVSKDKRSFDFTFFEGVNFAQKDELHLHRVTWKIKGPNDLVETFEMYDTGMKTDGATFTLKRIN